jgi:uncharacterized protein YkuJ
MEYIDSLIEIGGVLEEAEKFEMAGTLYCLIKYLEEEGEYEDSDSDYSEDEYGCVEEDIDVNVDERGFYSLS